MTRSQLVLAGAIFAFLALYLYLLRNVGLANDEWTFMLYRTSGFQAIVLPYNNGPVVGEILLYRLWAGTVGVGHHWVLSLVYGAAQAAVASLVFGMARRRVGSWPALGTAVLVLFLGRAWETILFPATLTFVLPTLAACAAWWALDRDRAVAAGLTVALLLTAAAVTGGLGPALLIGLVAEIGLRRRWGWLAVLAPGAGVLIAWYAGEWGNTGTRIGTNLPHLPLWAAKYLVSAAGAVFGLPPAGGLAALPLAVVAIVWWRRAARPLPLWSPRAVGLLVTLAAAVISIGAARAADTPATTSRYLYFPAIVMLLLACEWVRGLQLPQVRWVRWVRAAGVLVVLLAVGLGVEQLRHGKSFYWQSSDGTAARMGTVELAGGPAVVIEPSRLEYTPAALASFIRRYGSAPIDDEARLATALPGSRAAADQLLAQADIRPARPLRSCRRLTGNALPAGGLAVAIRPPTPATGQLVRFSPPGRGVSFPLEPPRTAFALRGDRVRRPWRLLVPANAVVQVCAFSRAAFSLR